MIDKLQVKIDKHIASYDVDFHKDVHVFEFVDGTIIDVPLQYSVYVSKEEATIMAIVKYLESKEEKDD